MSIEEPKGVMTKIRKGDQTVEEWKIGIALFKIRLWKETICTTLWTNPLTNHRTFLSKDSKESRLS